MVVLPTPPLRLITTTRREPSIGVRSRRSSSSRRRSSGPGPGLSTCAEPTYTARRHPDCGAGGLGREHRLVVEVRRRERRGRALRDVEGSGFESRHGLLLLSCPALRAGPQQSDQGAREPPEHDGHADERHEDQGDRQHRDPHRRPVSRNPGDIEHPLLLRDPRTAQAHELREVPDRPAEREGQHRHHHEHPAGHHAPRVRPQLAHPRVGRVPGAQAAQHRPHPGEEVRHAGHIGQDVVAVEAHHRDQLLEHLDLHHHGTQQEQPTARGEVRHREPHHAEHVEVEPAQVGPHAAGPVEPVGLGDVGVEGEEDDVDADADLTRLGPAVPAGRGVAQLVDTAPRVSRPYIASARVGVVNSSITAVQKSAPREEGHVGRHQGHQGEQDDRPAVERAEVPRQVAGQPRRDQGALGGQGEERTRLQGRADRAALVVVHEPEWLQSRGDQVDRAPRGSASGRRRRSRPRPPRPTSGRRRGGPARGRGARTAGPSGRRCDGPGRPRRAGRILGRGRADGLPVSRSSPGHPGVHGPRGP